MSRLATLLLSIVDAIRAFFTRASPPDPLAPRAPRRHRTRPRPISPAVRSYILAGHTKEIQASLVGQIEAVRGYRRNLIHPPVSGRLLPDPEWAGRRSGRYK